MLPREKYDELRKLFDKIDKIIEETKPKDLEIRNRLWGLFNEINS